MNVLLGNLNISQFEERTGWVFEEHDRKWLNEHLSQNANIRKDSEYFHIFDMPFCCVVGERIYEQFKNLVVRYNNIKQTEEMFQVIAATETDEERLEKEREIKRKELEDRKNNPDVEWNVKWFLDIPISKDLNYEVMINTYYYGYYNIPKTIKGKFWCSRDEKGIHGSFELDQPFEDDNDRKDFRWLVGIGFYKNGHLFNGEDILFDRLDLRIENCLNDHREINDFSKQLENTTDIPF